MNYLCEIYKYYNRLEELLRLRKCLLTNPMVKNYREMEDKKNNLNEKNYKTLSQLVSTINMDI